MAKASEADFEACFELDRILAEMEKGYYPHYPPADGEEWEVNPDPVWFDDSNEDHLRFFHKRIMEIVERPRVNITRVIFGFKVAINNDVFDPNADTLEWHPSLAAAVEARQAGKEGPK